MSLETGILALIEELRHDLKHKLLGLVNDEGSSMRLPAYDGLVSVVFHVIEHDVELPRKAVWQGVEQRVASRRNEICEIPRS